MQSMRSMWAVLCAAFLVTACGGGGGGGGGGGSSPGAPALLSFNPSTVTANVEIGTSATLTVRATARDTSQFSSTVYVFVVDTAQVLTSDVQISAIDATNVSATLHTRPALALGRYQGNFQVKLCRDSACASEFAGSPVALPYDITVANAPLRASLVSTAPTSVHRGETLSTSSNFSVTVKDLAWTAQAADSWLQVVNGSGTGNGNFQLRYLTTGLAEGNYASSVTVTTSDGQSVKLPISMQVLPVSFVLTSGIPSFNAVNGAPIAAAPLSFDVDNKVASNWSARSLAQWLSLSPTSGVTPGTLSLQPDPSRGSLVSGSYSGEVVLSSAGIADKSVVAQLKLTLPTLSSTATSVTLGGDSGHDFSTPQKVTLALNTGSNTWPFTVSGLPAWLSSASVSNSVGQAGTELSFTPVVDKLAAGSNAAVVMAKAVVNGDTVSLPLTVNINADQRRLLAGEWGVALASSPVGTTLTRSIRISDNYGGTLNWTANADVPWLTVSASGTTGGQLSLSADPASLPDNAVSYATVTLATTAPNVLGATVRVALWKSSSAGTATTTLAKSYKHLTADRLRPYVYANSGATDIDVYNAYSGQKVRTLAGVGAALGEMTVSLDGSRLYALDTAAAKMQVVDLLTNASLPSVDVGIAVNHTTGLTAARPNGTEVVFLGNGRAYDAAGRQLSTSAVYGQHLQPTLDGQALVSLGGRYNLDYSSLAGGMVLSKLAASVGNGSGGNLQAVAINADGSRMYAASGGGVFNGGYKCEVDNGATGAYIGALPGGEPYPNNVVVTRDGRPICGLDGIYATYDIWVHSPAGALLKGYKVSGYAKGLLARQMVVTPDGLVVVALSEDPLIAFVPIGS